jgi:hypothetical protein
MHDVVAQVVLATGDEDLGALQAGSMAIQGSRTMGP